MDCGQVREQGGSDSYKLFRSLIYIGKLRQPNYVCNCNCKTTSNWPFPALLRL
uniref:Uncharacterized protein n=1 Tax=Anguilla anguilla TaxID=7936 RepID=A0A0E9ULC1_ANGAN